MSSDMEVQAAGPVTRKLQRPRSIERIKTEIIKETKVILRNVVPSDL